MGLKGPSKKIEKKNFKYMYVGTMYSCMVKNKFAMWVGFEIKKDIFFALRIQKKKSSLNIQLE